MNLLLCNFRKLCKTNKNNPDASLSLHSRIFSVAARFDCRTFIFICLPGKNTPQ